MLDFICMGPVDLPGARRKRQNTKWKISCPQWDSNSQPFDSKSDALPTELAGLGEWYPFKWPYYIQSCTPDTNVYIIISTRMTKDSVFCLVNVLFCVTYWNTIYKCCTNSKETHMLAFNMQTRPNILPDLVFARWKQAQDLCVSLLFVKYTFIPICNTKQYIYKTDYVLLHHSGTYNQVNIGIGSTWM